MLANKVFVNQQIEGISGIILLSILTKPMGSIFMIKNKSLRLRLELFLRGSKVILKN